MCQKVGGLGIQHSKSEQPLQGRKKISQKKDKNKKNKKNKNKKHKEKEEEEKMGKRKHLNY